MADSGATDRGLSDLRKAWKRARAAWKKDKENESLRKACRKAKRAFREAEKANEEVVGGVKAAKDVDCASSPVSVGDLKAQIKKTRREWKAGGKTDKSLKKKLKRLKSELEGRSGGVSAAEGESKSSSSGGKKRKADAAVGVESGQKRPRANNESGDAQTPSAKVHMGNLNYAITDQDISEFFQGYGEIQEVFWICNKHTQRFSGMGFITFDSVNNAKRAVDEKHETECMGRRIKLNFAREYKERPERQDRGPKLRPVKPLSERPAEPYTVFIGNLSYDVTDESMTSYAEEKAGEGTVSAVRWITDRDSGEFKGAGYIDFATTDAVDAFVTLNGAVWMGRQLRVDYAVPKY